jgi:hypothetical protein
VGTPKESFEFVSIFGFQIYLHLLHVANKLSHHGLLTTGAQVPFLLAINTAAISLPIQIQFFRFLYTFLPTLTKISIDKWDPMSLTRFLAELANQFVILPLAVQQGGGKSIHTALRGKFGGCV